MYEELITALRACLDKEKGCDKCPYYGKCMTTVGKHAAMMDAADAIEEMDNILNLYRQGKITRPVTEKNKSQKIAKCYFFEDEHDAYGNFGVCYGTREKERCKCGGDFTKCDMPSENERVRNAYKFTDYDNKEQFGESEQLGRRSKWNLDGSCPRCGKHSMQT